MSHVWDKIIPLSESIIKNFKDNEYPAIYTNDVGDDYVWKNYIFEGDTFRRAHIEIVDARESKKIWVMHMTIFPHVNDPSPIFGFDVVCGANKITGAFHDFSKIGECDLYEWYQNKMANMEWNKPRDLPDWAKQIFSPHMLAAGNINTDEELDKLTDIVIDNMDHYLYNVGINRTNIENIEQYNKYCRYQKMNPHTPAMMINLGVDETKFKGYMDNILFPEL